jgi:hypothetical protein
MSHADPPEHPRPADAPESDTAPAADDAPQSVDPGDAQEQPTGYTDRQPQSKADAQDPQTHPGKHVD